MNIKMTVSLVTLHIKMFHIFDGIKNEPRLYFLLLKMIRFTASHFDVNHPFKQVRNLFMIALSRS